MTMRRRRGPNGKIYECAYYSDYGYSDNEYSVSEPEDVKPVSGQRLSRASSKSAVSGASSLSSASASSVAWQRKPFERRSSLSSTISLGIDIAEDEVKITNNGQSEVHRSETRIDPRRVAARVGIKNVDARIHVKYRGLRKPVADLLFGDTAVFSDQLEELPLALTHGQAGLDGYKQASGEVYGVRSRARPGLARKLTQLSTNEMCIRTSGDYTRHKAEAHTIEIEGRKSSVKPFTLTQTVTLHDKDHPELYSESLADRLLWGGEPALLSAKHIKRTYVDKKRGQNLLAHAKDADFVLGENGTRLKVERHADGHNVRLTGNQRFMHQITEDKKTFLRKAGLVSFPTRPNTIFSNDRL